MHNGAPLPISLCMIVKNEEKYLADCLASVQGLVSEMIVVDTGSTDRTVEIAKNFGAKVPFFEWINDFSAARNFAIEHATQPWILQLDADEELLGSESIPWFELFFKAEFPHIDAWYLEIRNLRFVNDPEVMVTHSLPRFYRNRTDLRYEFKIHENIRILNSASASHSKAVIIHKGYADQERKLEKAGRNFRLLKQLLAEKPDDPVPNFYFAQQYFSTGDRENGYRAARKAVKLGAYGIFRVNALRMMLSWTVDHGTLEQINEAFELSLPPALFPERVLYEAILSLRVSDADLAYQKLEEFLTIARVYVTPPNFDGILPDNHRLGYQLKAEIEESRGQIDLAIKSLSAGLGISPTHWQNRTKLAHLYFQQGDLETARIEFSRTLLGIISMPDGTWKKPAIDNMNTILEKLDRLIMAGAGLHDPK